MNSNDIPVARNQGLWTEFNWKLDDFPDQLPGIGLKCEFAAENRRDHLSVFL